ncbi:MAG: hypothetical protein P8181_08835 [bacterium]
MSATDAVMRNMSDTGGCLFKSLSTKIARSDAKIIAKEEKQKRTVVSGGDSFKFPRGVLVLAWHE